MKNLIVPKDKLDVTLRFDDKRSAEGTIFIGAYPLEAALFSKVSALLESKKVFLPFIEHKTGRTVFINKRNLRSMEWELPGETEKEAIFTGIMHSEKILATFFDGGTMEGTLLCDAPAEEARLSDCLNQPQSFLILKDGQRHMYLNKAMVREVVNR